ncbi:signal transduction histidine kinase [Massilia sp. MP_M2]|uniref:sensor histidine kinase n=1 Tax=Massilia sp. MP_M2 TaxID=3071713 RepID=UPI00319D9DB9
MKTRTYLFLMAGAILLPVAIASWIGLSMLLDWERDSRLRSVREMARATAFQIDREIAAAEASLRSVAYSDWMRQRDYANLQRWTLSTNEDNEQSWTVLYDSSGRELFTTQAPIGTKLLSKTRDWASQVSLEGGTLVSGYFIDEYSGRPSVGVSVPAPLADGQYNIVSQIFDVRFFERILRHDAIADDWKVGIFDRDGVAIMRNRGSDTLGQPMGPDFLAAVRSTNHGVFRHVTQDGRDVYGVFTHSKSSDWTIVIGVPVAQIEAAARTATWYAALVLLLLLGLAVAVALYLGRTLERALSQAAAAVTLLAGGAIALPARTRVEEVDALVEGLATTSEALARESQVRKSLQDERELLLVSEQHARRVAEAQSRAKDDFLAMLGHELRNPLAAISGAMSVLDMPNLKPQVAANARDISRRQMRHLTCIVDDLLDVQRILSGKIVLHRARVDVAQIVRSSAEAKALVDAGAHAWTIETIPDAWVDGDRTRLEQVVDNLLHNAIKYTPKGGRVDVRVWRDGDQVAVSVSDTGVGIAPELHPLIFDVLVQGPTSIDRGQGGLGLGLALVKQLTALHGGTVAVHSDGPGKGSCFVVRVPAMA